MTVALRVLTSGDLLLPIIFCVTSLFDPWGSELGPVIQIYSAVSSELDNTGVCVCVHACARGKLANQTEMVMMS